MKTLVQLILIVTMVAYNIPARAAGNIRRVILLYIDGFHPEVMDRFHVPNINELVKGGTSAQKGIMTFPAHPTIWDYGQYHTTSLPNITTLAGSMFPEKEQHFFHHDLPDEFITLQAGGSTAYRSMNKGFDYALTEDIDDGELMDYVLGIFRQEEDIQFCRIQLQNSGTAGRKDSGEQQENVPWAQNIFAPGSPYQKAVENADKEIGRLFLYLRESGKWDSTLLVFMGDGQAIAGWHLFMYEDSWLTPIIFHGPGIKKSHQIPYAENIDVIPTISWLWNIPMRSINGGTGRILREIAEGEPDEPENAHPRWTEKINHQLREYTVLKAKADLLSAKDPRMNLFLMKLMHSGLSEHQFYNYDRIMEWKQAGTLQQMYESNQWVINQLMESIEKMETKSNDFNRIYQIRVYELNEYNKEQFLIRFKEHASRIMKRHGFEILNMWETNYNGKPEFVYLLEWQNEDALNQGWKNFLSDNEWIRIRDETNKKYGKLVGERIEDRILQNI